jgi:hypothetical protein
VADGWIPFNRDDPEFHDWLRSLGIEPSEVPRDTDLIFYSEATGAALLALEVIARDSDGHRLVRENEFVREYWTVELPRPLRGLQYTVDESWIRP